MMSKGLVPWSATKQMHCGFLPKYPLIVKNPNNLLLMYESIHGENKNILF